MKRASIPRAKKRRIPRAKKRKGTEKFKEFSAEELVNGQ
jgi:hypothetical protein